jgi:two-component system chemotaxis response regulator CheY
MKSAIVIDDDLDFRSSFSALLQIHKIRVVGQGKNGKDAVNLYMKLVPEIIFLDILMPKYDGMWAVEKIKAINNNSMVIVITSDITSSTLQRLTSLGITNVLYKPVNIEKILNIVDNQIPNT